MGNSSDIVASLVRFADGFPAPQNTRDVGSKLAQPVSSETESQLYEGGAVCFGCDSQDLTLRAILSNGVATVRQIL